MLIRDDSNEFLKLLSILHINFVLHLYLIITSLKVILIWTLDLIQQPLLSQLSIQELLSRREGPFLHVVEAIDIFERVTISRYPIFSARSTADIVLESDAIDKESSLTQSASCQAKEGTVVDDKIRLSRLIDFIL